MYQVEITPDFDEDIKSLDRPIAARIISKIEWLAEHPELLKNPPKHMPEDLNGLQKYRIGNHRVLFWVDRKNKSIVLYGVEHRRSVYRKI